MVLDASALIEWLLQTPRGKAVEAHTVAAGSALSAPHLIDLEVAQVLRRFVAAGSISAALAIEVLTDLAVLPMRRYPHAPLIPRIWALRRNVTAYDAAYIALAEGLNQPVLTCDAKLTRIPGSVARVVVVNTPSS